MTFVLQYAINRTMFFTYEWFWFEILESYAETWLQLLTDIQLVEVICIPSAKVCGYKAMHSEENKQRMYKSWHKSETSNCSTIMWARVGTCTSVSNDKSSAMSLKSKRFPSNAANQCCTKYWPNIVK